MSASEHHRDWLNPSVLRRLNKLEECRRRIQSEFESARHGVERVTSEEAGLLRATWRRYCEVIAELDRTMVELEANSNGMRSIQP
jgi:hypothetical protein